MEKDLVTILEEIDKKISKVYSGKIKERFAKEITGIINEYKTLEVPDTLNATYESLMNKGKELMKESNIKNDKKVAYYLKYCGAAIYDFKGNLKPLNTIMKSFLLTSMLFFILAPQYFSFILPLIFVLPVFLGFRGIRKRVMQGLMLGMSIVPMAVLVSVVWIRNAILTAGNFSAFVNGIAQQYGFSYQFTFNLTVACIAMSVIMLISSMVLLYNGIKHRKMFI